MRSPISYWHPVIIHYLKNQVNTLHTYQPLPTVQKILSTFIPQSLLTVTIILITQTTFLEETYLFINQQTPISQFLPLPSIQNLLAKPSYEFHSFVKFSRFIALLHINILRFILFSIPSSFLPNFLTFLSNIIPTSFDSHPLFSNSFPTQIPSSTFGNDFFSISSFLLEWMKIQKYRRLKNITKQEIVRSRIRSTKKRFFSMIM